MATEVANIVPEPIVAVPDVPEPVAAVPDGIGGAAEDPIADGSNMVKQFLELEQISDSPEEKQEYPTLFDDNEGDSETEKTERAEREVLTANLQAFNSFGGSTLTEEDATVSEAGPSRDVEEETHSDEGSYLSDEDDELKLRRGVVVEDSESDTDSDSDEEDEEDGAGFHNVFEKAFAKKNDFLDQTGAAVDILYRRLTSLSIHKTDRAQKRQRSLEDVIVKGKVKDAKKKIESKGKSDPKKSESFLTSFQKLKLNDEDERTRDSSATHSTAGNSLSSQSNDAEKSPETPVPCDSSQDASKAAQIDCNSQFVGCIKFPDQAEAANGNTTHDEDYMEFPHCAEKRSETAKEIVGAAIGKVKEQPVVTALHDKFIAPCTSQPPDDLSSTKRAKASPSMDEGADGTDSLVEKDQEGDAVDQENSDNAKKGSPHPFAPVGSFVDKYGVMFHCGRDNEGVMEPAPISAGENPEEKEGNVIDPSLLQAEAKNLAQTVVRMASASKALHRVRRFLKTNADEGTGADEESPILREVDQESTSPWDESVQHPGQTSDEVVPEKAEQGEEMTPDQVEESIENPSNSSDEVQESVENPSNFSGLEEIPDQVQESIKNAERLLAESFYGPCTLTGLGEETANLVAPLRKSIEQHAEMIISSSAYGPCMPDMMVSSSVYGPCFSEDAEGGGFPFGIGCEATEVSLVAKRTNVSAAVEVTEGAVEVTNGAVELTEGHAIELDEQKESETTATDAMSLSSPEPEPAKEDDEYSSKSVRRPVKLFEKAKKTKKQSFWKSKRSKRNKESNLESTISSTIVIKNEDIEVTTPVEEVVKTKTKKARRLSQRKKKRKSNSSVITATHVKLSSSGNVHAILPLDEPILSAGDM